MKTDYFLSFINGEPYAVCKKGSEKEYKKIEYSNEAFNSLLENVEYAIIGLSSRPNFAKDIWPALAKCLELQGYRGNYNLKDYINSDSFESRFTREISAFIDEFSPRYNIPEDKKRQIYKARSDYSLYYSSFSASPAGKRIIKRKSLWKH